MFGLVRLTVVLVAFAMMFAPPVRAFDFRGTPFRAVPDDLVKTCDHYDNRSRFKTRLGRVDLEVLLADGCAAALRSLVVAVDTNPFVAKRAVIFLERLNAFKTTIIEINVERLFGVDAAPRSQPLAAASGTQMSLVATSRPVSPAGEYLIAREMGLLDAYHDWRNSSGFELRAAAQ